MDVAHHQRSPFHEISEPWRSRIEDPPGNRWIGNRTDPDVDHRRTRLHKLRRYESRASYGGDENIRRPGDGGEVWCFRVADRDRRVTLQEQHRHRFSDDLTAPDHHRVAAGHANVAALQHLDDTRWSARHQVRPSLDKTANIDGMKTVDVF